MGRFLDSLNHPILFVLFLILAMKGLSSVIVYISKRLGLSGPASFFQNT